MIETTFSSAAHNWQETLNGRRGKQMSVPYTISLKPPSAAPENTKSRVTIINPDELQSSSSGSLQQSIASYQHFRDHRTVYLN